MLKSLAKSSVAVRVVSGSSLVRGRIPLVPCLVRGFTTSNNSGNNSSVPDHSNFEGVKNSTSTADHSNFNGPQGIAEVLKNDAINKHRTAARTGDIGLEVEARVEQSMADRLRNQQQAGILSDAEEQGLAYMLKADAAQKQSLADTLQNEARREQSLADSILSSSQKSQQANQQSLEEEGDPDIEYHVGSKTFHTPHELKLDAAQKQSVAAKTHDEALMREARLEQSVADALSRNQPAQGQVASNDQDTNSVDSGLQQLAVTEDDPYDIFEELTIELSEYPDLTDGPQIQPDTSNSRQL